MIGKIWGLVVGVGLFYVCLDVLYSIVSVYNIMIFNSIEKEIRNFGNLPKKRSLWQKQQLLPQNPRLTAGAHRRSTSLFSKLRSSSAKVQS